MDKAILKHKFNTIVQDLAQLIFEAGTDYEFTYNTSSDKLQLWYFKDDKCELIAEHSLLIDNIKD